MVSHTGKMNGTPKTTCPFLSVAKHFFFSESRRPTALKFLGTEDVFPVERIPLITIPITQQLLCVPPTLVCSSDMLFLIFHLSCCTHRGICEQFGSASQWYLSAPPVKIKWMNHAHRLCLRHRLPSNFTTCFPVSAKSDRGANTSWDTKFSLVLENRYPHRRNWQCNCKKGSRTSSGLTRPEYTLQTQGNHVSLGLQLMEVLDSMAKCSCMSGGRCALCFLSYVCMTSRVKLALSIPRSTLTSSGMENGKISALAKGNQYLPIGVI